MKWVLLLAFVLSPSLVLAQEVFLLTKALDFSSSPGLKSARPINVGKHPTLLKKVSESKGVVKVQLLQQNGKAVNKTLYVSAKWFNRGTQAKAEAFHADPNQLVRNATKAPEPDCQEDEPVSEKIESYVPIMAQPYTGVACSVLEGPTQEVDLFLKCFEDIQKRLQYNSASAYKSLSKLYTLSPSEQKFMAMILTMYGEARGAHPPEAQMAAVMKVIENRTTKARETDPTSNELDVVLQDAQFSMYNPKDKNWRAALSASPDEMRGAVKVFASRGADQCVSKPPSKGDFIYHYATSELCSSSRRPNWIHQGKKIQLQVGGSPLTSSGAHYFYADVPWRFNSSNRYREYAEQQGDI